MLEKSLKTIALRLNGCLDDKQLQELADRSLLPLAKALQDLGVQCTEVKTKAGNPSSFFAPKMRPREAAKRVCEFWAAAVPVTSVDCSARRAYVDELVERLVLF